MVEDGRRRARCGTPGVRPGGRSHLLRHRQRRTVARGAARLQGQGQPVRLLDHRAASRHRRDEVVLPGRARRLVGLRQRAAADPGRRHDQRPAARASSCRRTRTASSTCSIASPASSSRREPFAPLNWATGIDRRRRGRPLDPSRGVLRHDAAGDDHRRARSARTTGRRCRSIRRTGLVYIPTTLGTSTTYTVQPGFRVPRRRDGIPAPAAAARGARARAAGGDPVLTAARPGSRRSCRRSIGPDARRASAAACSSRGIRSRSRSAGRQVGRRQHRAAARVTTAGNLVFQVLADGRLLAYTADTGEQLLEIQTGQRSGMGPPMTYSVDGRQYVTLMGGRGAGAAAPAPGGGQPAAGGGRGNPLQPGPGVPPRMLTFVLDGKDAAAESAVDRILIYRSLSLYR